MKDEVIKGILLELIYTPDAKPRFVNGDISTKLAWIDEAVEKIIKATKVSKYDTASKFLCSDAKDDLKSMVDSIERQSDIDDTTPIDRVKGVLPIEQFEYTFTCGEFLTLINS
jgi:hypothetical protein